MPAPVSATTLREPLIHVATSSRRCSNEAVPLRLPCSMSYGFPNHVKTIIVCPSLSFPTVELRKITGIEHYEERMLFVVLALRDPAMRVIYLSSMPVDDDVIAYYLSFVDDEHARRRLHLLSVGDPEPRALTGKLLQSSELIGRLCKLVGDRGAAYLLPFNVTSSEAALAEALGVPLFGPPLRLIQLGSKTGARRVARTAGVEVLDGAEDLRSEGDIEKAVVALLQRRPDAAAVVIKLNNGFSGQGNAIVEAGSVRAPLRESPVVFCAPGESWATFAAKAAATGAVVEELLRAPGLTSPSAQLRIEPGGHFSIISTHDQILGGPDDQVYLGCRFPARSEYRHTISSLARRIAAELAMQGVIGSFGVDFVVAPTASGHRAYLTEINLRVGGTTHPFEMARLATRGRYDESSGELLAGGRPKYYVATDNLKSDRYLGLTPGAVIEAMYTHGLAFDPASNTGVTLHLLGALSRYGKVGIVSIANSDQEAEQTYRSALGVLDTVAAARVR
jgi:PGM1 C-terminal domain/ATP-grasp domain/Pre ATP-grasp domain